MSYLWAFHEPLWETGCWTRSAFGLNQQDCYVGGKLHLHLTGKQAQSILWRRSEDALQAWRCSNILSELLTLAQLLSTATSFDTKQGCLLPFPFTVSQMICICFTFIELGSCCLHPGGQLEEVQLMQCPSTQTTLLQCSPLWQTRLTISLSYFEWVVHCHCRFYSRFQCT